MADWYYTQDGEQRGPVSQDDLRQLGASGQLQPDDLIWKDGMPNWVRADSAKGLIPDRGAAPPAPAGHEDYVEARPRRRRPPAGYDEPEEEWEDERRPRRSVRKKSMSAGLLWGIIGGSVALVAGVVVLVIVLLSGGGSGGGRTFSLRPTKSAEFHADLKKGAIVEITAKTNQNASVRLHVYDPVNRTVASSFHLGRNTTVVVVPNRTGKYRIKVSNLARGNISGNVSWQTYTINNNTAGVKPVPTTIAAEVTARDPMFNGKFYKDYTFSFNQNQTYVIELFSSHDNYLYIKDSTGRIIARNDDSGPGLNARLTYRPFRSGTYKVTATTFGRGRTGQYLLKVHQNTLR